LEFNSSSFRNITEVAFLFGYIDFDLNYGNYEEKESILEFISQYQYELTQDAFISFGLIYNDDESLLKYLLMKVNIKYWE
jgi:hypothetical protein